ncbi:M23 family metallopeptidase [Thermosulfurimonas sp. F29]|uniref:M23 family metallopeptidase n=1 Tax=Thermosulfurimonas sp. F29 TaxID=2867247 RepID=UPI001C833EE4|nr:M23 family metallopeptidase [Thermosulfurimonas sp. F29]MBX6422182.1 M23 family metallopeptidase [Thermosulfurimonas sp. F29]
MKSVLKGMLLLLLLALCGAAVFVFFVKLESHPPVIEVKGLPKLAGRKLTFTVRAEDRHSGLRELSVYLVQGRKKILLKELGWPVSFLRGSRVHSREISFSVSPVEKGLSEGPAVLVVSAADASWRNRLRGNLSVKRVPFTLDLTPPRVTVLSRTVYLAPGGSALVLYRVGEKPARTGVLLNDRFFRGYPLKQGAYAALVALPVTEKVVRKFVVLAEDGAGNRLELPVSYYLKRRRFPRVRMRLSDRFLNFKMPEFISRYPEAQKNDLLGTFIWVNETLRRRNNKTIAEITSRPSEAPFRISGALRALPHAAKRADFGEFRTYYYRGRKVSRAWHLGLDLASVARSPVPAAAPGRVVFADYLGIYGNTVILDHGLGLYTLYAHLAGIEVQVGEEVSAGQTIGHTDTTGLAGGDHLHFSVLVQGVFVTPIEWLDPRWVRTRILDPLKDYR